MIFPKVFLLIGKKWIEEKGGSDGKTSVSCQGPPTTMIYDFADGAQTVHTVSFPNFQNSLFVYLIKDFGSFASLHTNMKVCAVIP